jgi:hypothetical protein
MENFEVKRSGYKLWKKWLALASKIEEFGCDHLSTRKKEGSF